MSRRAALTRMWECAGMAVWVRVGLYAQEHHGVYLAPGRLASVMQTSPDALSRAITRAKDEGIITHDSSARTLYSRVRS